MIRAEFITGIVTASASPLPLPTALPTGSPSIVVYHVRDGAATPTPEGLLHAKGVHVNVSTDPADVAAAQAAVDAAGASLAPAAPFDARWAIRFETATGRSVHSVYCDAGGAAGQIDGHAVTFANGASLIAYLERRFGER